MRFLKNRLESTEMYSKFPNSEFFARGHAESEIDKGPNLGADGKIQRLAVIREFGDHHRARFLEKIQNHRW